MQIVFNNSGHVSGILAITMFLFNPYLGEIIYTTHSKASFNQSKTVVEYHVISMRFADDIKKDGRNNKSDQLNMTCR